MNKVILMGRLTRDPEVRYSAGDNSTAVARYTLAVNRRFKRDNEPTADFVPCVAFGNALNFIENEDIYSLFGNLIDNSIEAVNQLDDNEKIISLKIKQVGNIVSISIKNRYKGKIQMENNLPLSKKEDNIHHGFGMKSIKMVCEKYNGNLKLNIENNIFIVTILFIKRSD